MKVYTAKDRPASGGRPAVLCSLVMLGGLLTASAETNTTALKTLKALSLEELMQVEVATVTAASKKPEKVTDAPATVIVIGKEDILLRGYSTLRDVLRDLPGMEVIDYHFSEIGTLVPVRGIVGNNKIVVLVNGMRVNPPGGENMPVRSDFSIRQAERIEVVYGPGSTLYGQDAISAVINVITRVPGAAAAGEAGAAGGLNEEREAWASFGVPLGKDQTATLSGYIQYHDGELTRLDQDYPAWWAGYEAVSRGAQPPAQGDPPVREDFGLNVFLRATTAASSVQLWHRESERSSAEGFNSGLGYLSEAVWGDAATVVEAKNTLPLTERLKLDSAITYNRYEIDPDSRYVFPVPAPDGRGTNWFFDDYKYGLGTSFSGEETLKAELSPTLSLMAGAVATTHDIIPKSTVPGGADTDRDIVSQGGQFVYRDAAGVQHEIQRVVRERYDTYAGYLEVGWQMRPDLKGIAGTRVTQDTRYDDTPVTPRAALIYNLTDELTLKYIFTRAYVAPAPYFGFATYDNGRLLSTSNPDLKPETALSHEVSLDYSRKNLTAGISAYYGKEDNLLTLADRGTPANIVEPVVTLPDGSTRTLVQSVNGGNSENYGVDIYGRATVGSVSPWASYSYVDFEETREDQTTGLSGVSHHNGRLGVTWGIRPNLFVTPSLVVRSRPQNVIPGALDDELDLPYDLALHVLYRASRRVDLFAHLRNVTNNKYALGGVTGEAVPQETFSAVAGLRVTY